MAKKKDFYLKFDFKDFSTDIQLMKCSPATTGVYIRLICLLCQTESRGKYELGEDFTAKFASILLKQNVEQKNEQIGKHLLDVCCGIADDIGRLLSYEREHIVSAFMELLKHNVIYLEDKFICQKRMIRDAEISKMRASSGRKGGLASIKKQKKAPKKTDDAFAQNLLEQNVKQKPNYNYISINNTNTEIGEEKKEKEGIGNVRGVQGDENLGEREKRETPKNNLPPQNLNFNLHDTSKKSTKTLTLDAGDLQLLANFGESVRVEWLVWRQYLLDAHNKKTDNIQVKQQQLEKLAILSKGDEDLIVKIIRNCIANVWPNLHPLPASKSLQNGPVLQPLSDIDQRIAAETDPKKKIELQREKYAFP